MITRYAVGALALVACAQAQTQCGLDKAFTFRSTTVLSASDGSLFWTGPLAIDLDGAPNAYHPRGRAAGALDSICNGANVVLPDGTKIRGDTDCSKMIAAFNEARDSGWIAPGKPRVEWYGVASEGDTGDAKYTPCMQTSGQFAGFFVAQTALAADLGKGRCDTARWVNPVAIPFFVLPRNSEFLKRGAKKGDVAAVTSTQTGVIAFAVVGDIGPPDGLGEGSLALANQLRGRPVPERASLKDLKGAAFASGVSFLVFKGSDPGVPYTPDRIAQRGRERLDAWGGDAKLKACAGGN